MDGIATHRQIVARMRTDDRMREPATKSQDGSSKTALADTAYGTKKSRDPKGSRDLNEKANSDLLNHTLLENAEHGIAIAFLKFMTSIRWPHFLLPEIRA
ncbi:MAG: hypothetical protein P8I27_07125 [Pirellulaceae bacterium]|nr:hypothetical protein [Pirellulaceae bacterium]